MGAVKTLHRHYENEEKVVAVGKLAFDNIFDYGEIW